MPDIGTLAARITLDPTGFMNGAQKVQSELKRIKQSFGEGGLFGQAGKLLVGGGVVAGVTILAKHLTEATQQATELVRQFQKGEQSFAQLTYSLVKSIPVLREIASLGEAIGDLGAQAVFGRSSADRTKQAGQVKAAQDFILTDAVAIGEAQARSGLPPFAAKARALSQSQRLLRNQVDAVKFTMGGVGLTGSFDFLDALVERGQLQTDRAVSLLYAKAGRDVGRGGSEVLGGIGGSIGRAAQAIASALVGSYGESLRVRRQGAIDRALSDATPGFGSLRLAEAGIDESAALFKARQTAAALSTIRPAGGAADATGLLTQSSAAGGFGERFGAITGAAPQTQNKILDANQEQVRLQRELVRQGRGGVVWTR